MPTTVLGFFNNQAKADDAIEELRQKFKKNNVSIMSRNQTIPSPVSASGSLNVIQQFSSQATKMGETAGGVMGRMAGMTMGAMMSVPMMMINTMMSTVSGMTSMGPNMAMMPGANTGSAVMITDNTTGAADNKITVTIQSDEDISYAQHVLKSHGAKEVNSYSS
ncbi:MAG: hypothetical protein M0Z31_02000 [Clostridia bacterium]|nr:hypothetical protein [Clostridia bacterium]